VVAVASLEEAAGFPVEVVFLAGAAVSAAAALEEAGDP
jgi:hypothetical protein